MQRALAANDDPMVQFVLLQFQFQCDGIVDYLDRKRDRERDHSLRMKYSKRNVYHRFIVLYIALECSMAMDLVRSALFYDTKHLSHFVIVFRMYSFSSFSSTKE